MDNSSMQSSGGLNFKTSNKADSFFELSNLKMDQDNQKTSNTPIEDTSSDTPEENQKELDEKASPEKEIQEVKNSPETFLPEAGIYSAKHPEQKLAEMAEKMSQPLIQISSILPVSSVIRVDLRKITIDLQPLPFTHQSVSIPLEQIEDVIFESTFIFATLRLIKKNDDTPIKVSFLPVDQAKETKRIVLGLITAIKEQIKLGDLDPKRDKQKLIDIGSGANL